MYISFDIFEIIVFDKSIIALLQIYNLRYIYCNIISKISNINIYIYIYIYIYLHKFCNIFAIFFRLYIYIFGYIFDYKPNSFFF